MYQPDVSPCRKTLIIRSTNLDGLPVDAGSVELPHGSLGGVIVHHGDESVALAGVVDIGHLAASTMIFPFNLLTKIFRTS